MSMTWREQALSFACAGEQLFAVVSAPSGSTSDTGVVVIVGGPQYRVGSHRQFVLLARRLASAGYPVLRFDYRGMGDSVGELGHFERVERDVAAAIDALIQIAPGIRRVVLWGLCDGASAALLYVQTSRDARVRGLCLLNPWIRSETSQARTQVRHYYLDRLKQRAFWIKLLSGRVARDALSGFFGKLAAALQPATPTDIAAATTYAQRMALGWIAFAGPVLLMLSEQDYTAREFEAYVAADASWQVAFGSNPPERMELQQADHTCSQAEAELALHAATVDFLARVSSS